MNCSLNMYKYIRYHYTFYIPQLILVVRLPKVNDMFNITFIIPDLQGRSIKLKKKTIQTFERILIIYVYTCKYSEFSSYIEISCLVNFPVTFKDDPIAYLMYNPSYALSILYFYRLQHLIAKRSIRLKSK